MKKRYKAFTLVELLVSLAVIAIAVTSALTVMVFSQRTLTQDKDLQLSVDFSNDYFSRLTVCADLKKELFSGEESASIIRSGEFPVIMGPMTTNLSRNVQAIISRKVNRWSPLLIDIGIEIIVTGNKNAASGDIKRNFWFETTFSEKYLKKMI